MSAPDITPTPWRCDNRDWRGKEDLYGHWYIRGNRRFVHAGEDDDGRPVCACDCDGDRDVCDCLEGCHWLSTAVCRVEGNATSAPLTENCARYLCAAVNACCAAGLSADALAGGALAELVAAAREVEAVLASAPPVELLARLAQAGARLSDALDPFACHQQRGAAPPA